MSLDQLMAFTVTTDHDRQEQVWEAIQRSYGKEPYQIRRMLTEETVRASDRLAGRPLRQLHAMYRRLPDRCAGGANRLIAEIH